MCEEKERWFRHRFSAAVASVVLGCRSSIVGRRSSVVGAEAEAEAEASLPIPAPSPTADGIATLQCRSAPASESNLSSPPRLPQQPWLNERGKPFLPVPERLRLPRCPGNLSLGLATTASVYRGSIHGVPSPRSFSSVAFSALFFPPLFLILVFLLLYPF